MKVFDFGQVIGNVGIAVYCFEANGVIVNIKAETKKQQKYPCILLLAVATIWFGTIAYSLFAYYVFKSDLEHIFTLTLQPINALVCFVLMTLSLSTFLGYPG